MVSDSALKAQLLEQWQHLGQTLAKQCEHPPAREALMAQGRRLCKAYAARGRHYHGLEHVAALLKLWREHQQDLKHPEQVALAIWYHDAVYNALRKDNEQRSAQWARQDLQRWGLPTHFIKNVVQMIALTAHHHALPETVSQDLLWFLDFDLSILGAEPEVYTRYVEQVRKEYRWVPEVLYRQGRVKVLKHMLQQDFLYYTPLFRQHKERPARENIRKEIAYWEHL